MHIGLWPRALRTQVLGIGLLLSSLLLGTLTLVSCGAAQNKHSMTEQQIAERKRLAAEIEDVAKEHVHMPKVPLDLPANRYLNTTPAALSPEALKGKIVLMDIWDYTCVNCIRTLPYIKEWNRRYADKGLVIIGIHAPEFEFEKTPGNLDSAVRSFGLTYPVIADNDFKL